MIFRAVIIWFVILMLAIGNGAVRVFWAIPRMGDRSAHVWSTLSLSALVLLAAWLTMPWVAPLGRRDAALIGALWLSLTVLFEFVAGHYLFGTPWPQLLADYNLRDGRIWLLVLLTTVSAPWIAMSCRDLPK